MGFYTLYTIKALHSSKLKKSLRLEKRTKEGLDGNLDYFGQEMDHNLQTELLAEFCLIMDFFIIKTQLFFN